MQWADVLIAGPGISPCSGSGSWDGSPRSAFRRGTDVRARSGRPHAGFALPADGWLGANTSVPSTPPWTR